MNTDLDQANLKGFVERMKVAYPRMNQSQKMLNAARTAERRSEMDADQEMKKFHEGLSYIYIVDCDTLHDWLHHLYQITCYLIDGKNFQAGHTMAILQDMLGKAKQELEKQAEIKEFSESNVPNR